jgi:putative membrane fusion protein
METNRRGLFNKKWIVAFLVYIGLVALCCVALYVVPSVVGMFERTYIAEHGKIDVADEVSAFIVRDERVYVAAQKSKINRLADSERLVKAGTKVVELTPSDVEDEELEAENAEEEADAKADDKNAEKSKDKTSTADKKESDDKKDDSKAEKSEAEKTEKSGKSETDKADKTDKDKEEKTGETDEEETKHEYLGKYSGIMKDLGDTYSVTEDGSTRTAGYVSYYVDGAEAKLSTKAIESLNRDDLKELSGRKAVKTATRHCGESYPVFKIVRNRKWYLVYYLKKDDAAKYLEGETVYIDVNDESIPVTVREVRDEGKSTRITLTCKTFFDGFLEERTLDTRVTVESAEGLVLEDGSIAEAPDGKRGVFVINKLGEHVFTPVKTKADDGTKCVVYSDIYVDEGGNYVETIGTYDEIIAEPSAEDINSLKKTKAKSNKN